MIFSRDFQQDCKQLLESISGPPIALVRFCDGEYAILKNRKINTADKWRVPDAGSLFTSQLYASAVYREPDYLYGIPAPCCMKEEYEYFRAVCSSPQERFTFANVFVDGNHAQVIQWVKDNRVLDECAIVSSSKLGHYTIPANAVNDDWDMEKLIEDLRKETRPILVAAGPAANVIIHKYWKDQPVDQRVTILDIGSVFDFWLHGRATRGYHSGDNPNRKKVCSWTISRHS